MNAVTATAICEVIDTAVGALSKVQIANNCKDSATCTRKRQLCMLVFHVSAYCVVHDKQTSLPRTACKPAVPYPTNHNISACWRCKHSPITSAVPFNRASLEYMRMIHICGQPARYGARLHRHLPVSLCSFFTSVNHLYTGNIHRYLPRHPRKSCTLLISPRMHCPALHHLTSCYGVSGQLHDRQCTRARMHRQHLNVLSAGITAAGVC
jgi:hypothetical protein